MSDAIPPALTPEEWECALRDDGDGAVVRTHTGEILGCWAEYCAGNTNHALAALALHGQPFGFEPGDEGLIEHAALTMEAYDSTEQNREIANELRAIARKIAALLPPQP